MKDIVNWASCFKNEYEKQEQTNIHEGTYFPTNELYTHTKNTRTHAQIDYSIRIWTVWDYDSYDSIICDTEIVSILKFKKRAPNFSNQIEWILSKWWVWFFFHKAQVRMMFKFVWNDWRNEKMRGNLLKVYHWLNEFILKV